MCRFLLGLVIGSSLSQADWTFPEGTAFYEYPSKLELSVEEVPLNPGQKLGLARCPQILARYDWIRAALRTRFGKPDHVETVFYPMSSYDVTLAPILFSEASTYIFVDDHPAYDRNNLPKALKPEFRKKSDDGLLVGGGKSLYVGNNILGEILKFMPGVKILQVRLFHLRDEQTYVFSKRRRLPAVHMEVKVRFAGGRKTLYYLNSVLGPDSLAEQGNYIEPWWFAEVRKLAPQAVILKARGQRAQDDLFDATYLSWLSKNSGFLLYDDLSPGSPLLTSADIEDRASVHLEEVYDTLAKRFGYDSKVSIIKY